MEFTSVRFTRAARRHRIATGRARHVIDNPYVIIRQPADADHPDPRILVLGEDDRGIALIVGGPVIGKELLVIHVQPITQQPRYQRLYQLGAAAMDNDTVTHEPDYDPDSGSELLYDSAGTPVTNDYLQRLADDLEHQDVLPADTTIEFTVTGRPSLTATGQTSPAVHFRVPARLRATVEQRAKREGKTVSALAREALERYVS